MRGVRYIHEQPNVGRSRRGTGLLGEPVVVGGLAVALGIMAWVGMNAGPAATTASVLANAASLDLTADAPRTFAPGAVVHDCPTCPELVVLPKGFYTLGAADDDPQARPQEKPRRGGSVTRTFAMGRFEVSVDEFTVFLAGTAGAAPQCEGVTRTGDQPQNCVSWNEAKAYAEWLSIKTGRRYRLPGADEWEYAAKAHGVAAQEPAETFETASAPARVAATKANGFGLHGMGGNLAELVADCWVAPEGTTQESAPEAGSCKRTVKDGSWLDTAAEARPSAKRAIRDDIRSVRVGFRLLRELTALERGD